MDPTPHLSREGVFALEKCLPYAIAVNADRSLRNLHMLPTRQRYLRQCGEIMSSVGRRWWLQLLLGQWREATLLAQEGRSDEARETVLLTAAFR